MAILVPFHLGADITPGSALDVSFLLHRPAGKRGTVRAQGERLVYGDGSPAAFWGVNLCWDALFPPPAEAPAIARRLAMSGVNLVRLTYLDGGPHGLFRQDRADSSTINEERRTRLDAFCAALRENGIYFLPVLAMGRAVLKPGDDAPAYALDTDPETAKAAYAIGRFFDSRIQQADQKVWRSLMRHVNPHTGKCWADDTAVATLEILNESSLFYRYPEFARVPEPLRVRIAFRWNRWRAAHGLSPATLDFSLLTTADPTREPLAAEWNRFLAEVCRDYYTAQIAFLRGLGVRCPISCNGGGSYSLADRWSNQVGDLFDQHQYHDHPNFGPGGLTYTNRSSLQTNLNAVQLLAKGRPAGLPYGVSEWDFCYPNEFRAEGSVPMAAYARLQGWSLLTAFAYSSSPWTNRAAQYRPEAGIRGVWQFHNDPATFGQWPLTALLFLRGDVRPAKQTLDIPFSEAEVFRREPPRFPPDRLQSLNGLPMVHAIRQVYDVRPRKPTPQAYTMQRNVAAWSRERDRARAGQKESWRVADTAELRYRESPGVFVLDTPRAQGVVGFAGTLGPLRTRDLILTLETDFASVVLTALDGKPIRRSRRLLLVAVGRCRNAGLMPQQIGPNQFRAGGPTFSQGPILIEPIRFTLELRHPASSATAYALDGSGNRTAPLPLAHSATGAWTFRPGDKMPATIYYELVAT